MLVFRGWEVEEMGRCWSKGTKSKLCGMNKSKGLIYSRMTRVNNSVLNTRNVLKE